jgi:GNAT superfamily N-acetyltransferase
MTHPPDSWVIRSWYIPQMPSKEKDQVIAMVDLAFQYELDEPNPYPGVEWLTPEYALVGYLNEKPVSHVGLVFRIIQVGEQFLRVAGIGGVSTHPDFQRRGYAARVMHAAQEWLSALPEIPFGMLFCSEERVPFYASLGWRVINAPMFIGAAGKRQLFDSPRMILLLHGEEWPVGEIDLHGWPW